MSIKLTRRQFAASAAGAALVAGSAPFNIVKAQTGKLKHADDRHSERRQHGERRQAARDTLRQAPPHHRVDDEAEEREQGN